MEENSKSALLKDSIKLIGEYLRFFEPARANRTGKHQKERKEKKRSTKKKEKNGKRKKKEKKT